LITDNSEIGPWSRDLLNIQFKYRFFFFLGLSTTISSLCPNVGFPQCPILISGNIKNSPKEHLDFRGGATAGFKTVTLVLRSLEAWWALSIAKSFLKRDPLFER